MNRILCETSPAIEPGLCWGRIVSEDSGVGACDLCVQICPEDFEKPIADRCARVRLGADPSVYTARLMRAVRECPVDAIHVAMRNA